MELSWLGHSTVVMDLDGTRIVADPMLAKHNGILRRRTGQPERVNWHQPDAVLLSHLHHDHAELRSLRMLGGAPILTAPLNAAWLRRKGIAGGTALGEQWYEVPDRPTRVRLVRADHSHRPMPHRPNQTNGHLVRWTSGTVWVVGDTSLYDEMADLPDLAQAPIDVAVVPVGGWGAKLSGGHMDPEQAAIACARVGARYAVPVHWGTLHVPLLRDRPRGWMDRPGEEFADALSRHAPSCKPVVLLPGDTATIPLTSSS
jgi:L-ascorbate metabolism protein UlaG (beta-lactamase superfamily)